MTEGSPPASGGSPLPVVAIVAAGLLGGLVGLATRIPAGPLLGSVITVGAIGFVRDAPVPIHGSVRVVARILIGSVVGSLVTLELLGELGGMALWAAVFTVFMIGAGLACAWVILRTTSLDPRTAVLASAPGGMSEMAALAEELGGRSDIVLAIQMLRKLAALAMAVAIVAWFAVT